MSFPRTKESQFLIFLFSRVDRNKYQIHIPLPPKIDPTVTMMQVEEKPDVTYSDVGGCKEQIEKLREVVETPLLHVNKTFHFRCEGDSIWAVRPSKSVNTRWRHRLT